MSATDDPARNGNHGIDVMMAGELRIGDNDDFKALYGRHWWYFIGPVFREVILPEDDYKILVNGELVWDDTSGSTARTYKDSPVHRMTG